MRAMLTALIFCASLAACNNAPSASFEPEPYSAQFASACIAHPQRTREIRRDDGLKRVSQYCTCIFDKTMAGLTDDEKQAARFYLFAQVNIDVKSMAEFKSMNLSATGVASQAIGKAVAACPRP